MRSRRAYFLSGAAASDSWSDDMGTLATEALALRPLLARVAFVASSTCPVERIVE